MKDPRQILADRRAQKAYDAELAAYDRQLAEMDAAGIDPASPGYFETWRDRMSYAYNCRPGAPAPEPPEPESSGPEPEASL